MPRFLITEASTKKFVRERLAGRSITQAAFLAFPDAPSKTAAVRRGLRLNKRIEQTIGLRLKEAGASDKIVHTVLQGMDAIKLIKDGEGPMEAMPDFSERRQNAELAGKFMGELSTGNNVSIQHAEFNAYLVEQLDEAKKGLSVNADFRVVNTENDGLLPVEAGREATGSPPEPSPDADYSGRGTEG